MNLASGKPLQVSRQKICPNPPSNVGISQTQVNGNLTEAQLASKLLEMGDLSELNVTINSKVDEGGDHETIPTPPRVEYEKEPDYFIENEVDRGHRADLTRALNGNAILVQ